MNQSIWSSCMEQILNDGDIFDINVNIMGDVIFTITQRNGKIGRYQLSFPEFDKIIKNLDVECALSNWMGKAYNDILEQEGSKTRLMV